MVMVNKALGKISLTSPHPLLQRREGVWGLISQPAVAQKFTYLCNPCKASPQKVGAATRD